MVFCRLCKNPSGYKLGCRKGCSMLASSLVHKNPGWCLKSFSMVQISLQGDMVAVLKSQYNLFIVSLFGSRVIYTFIGKFSA